MSLASQTDSKGAGGALKEAAVAALITLALCTPIIMFRTESDPNDGTLQLFFRPIAVLVRQPGLEVGWRRPYRR